MKKLITICLAAVMGSTASISAAWEEMEMRMYSNLQQNPVELTFTPETDGVLTISVYGGFSDPYLFNSEACAESNFVTPINGYTYGWDSEIITQFALEAGMTYYSKAPINSADPIMDIAYAWEPIESDGIEVIKEGEAFKAYDKVMKFTASETGVLAVTVNPFVYGLVGSSGQDWSFLYTDANHTNCVAAINPSGEEIENGIIYYFEVRNGRTYYFYQDTSSSATFTFNMSYASTVVTLLDINPKPGKAFDPVNYIGGAQMFFSPQNVSYGAVTFSYIANDGNEVTYNVTTEPQSDAIGLLITPYYNEAMNNALEGTSCRITVNGVNYHDVPLTVSNIEGVTIEEDGTLTFEYLIESPISLVNAKWPSVIYAYWAEGDSQGIAELEFDGIIKKVGFVTMSMGRRYYNSPTEDVFQMFDIPYTIDGNMLYIDFTGVERHDTTYKTVTIMVGAVVGENGLEAIFDGIPVLQAWMDYNNDNATTGIVLSSQDDYYQVYNMEGMKILTTKDKEAIDSLPKGFYIINGQKVLKR